METLQQDTSSALFAPGSHVVYGLIGKCLVEKIETRTLSGKPESFYKLQPVKYGIIKSKKVEPSILVPITTAVSRGLRAPLTAAELPKIYSILESREFYLPVGINWRDASVKIEKLVMLEGAQGLAKAMSYLYVVKNRQVVPPNEVQKLFESIQRLLVREICELTVEPMSTTEVAIEKKLKNKLTLDN